MADEVQVGASPSGDTNKLLRLLPQLVDSLSDTNVAADTDVFSSALEQSAISALFRAHVVIDLQTSSDPDPILTVKRSPGAGTLDEILNDRVPVLREAVHLFDIMMPPGDTVNFQFSEAVTVRSFYVFRYDGR